LFMGIFDSYILWAIFRFVSGVSSGTVFVLASNVALEALKMVRKERISGLIYSGVGLGIFSSSIFIFLFTSVNSWKKSFFLFCIFSLIMTIFIIFDMLENICTDHY